MSAAVWSSPVLVPLSDIITQYNLTPLETARLQALLSGRERRLAARSANNTIVPGEVAYYSDDVARAIAQVRDQ